jgi:hypothetical protein
MTISKFGTLAFTVATSALALLGIASATVGAEDAPAIEGFADYIPYANGMDDPSGLTSLRNDVVAGIYSGGIEGVADYIPYVNGMGDPSGLTSPHYDPVASSHTGSTSTRFVDLSVPPEAYFEVNLYYCTLPAGARDAGHWVPTGAAAVVHEVVLIGAYGGNCDAFYSKEVRPRLYLSDEQS